MVRLFYLGMGLLSTIVGIVLMPLPGPPLGTLGLLIAVFFFARSSPRIHGWLLGNRWFGSDLTALYEHRIITRKSKKKSLIIVVVTTTLVQLLLPMTMECRAIYVGWAVASIVIIVLWRSTPKQKKAA